MIKLQSSLFSQIVVLLDCARLWPGARRMCACADAICNEQRRRWRVFYFETRYINVSLMLSDIAWKAKSFVNKRFVRRKLHGLSYTLNLRWCLPISSLKFNYKMWDCFWRNKFNCMTRQKSNYEICYLYLFGCCGMLLLMTKK